MDLVLDFGFGEGIGGGGGKAGTLRLDLLTAAVPSGCAFLFLGVVIFFGGSSSDDTSPSMMNR